MRILADMPISPRTVEFLRGLSRAVLEPLGIETMETVSFQLADNRIVEYEVGEARVRLDGRERTTLVVFGPEGAAPLLGATTLQLFNLAADATRERLVTVPALLKQLSQEVSDLVIS